MSAPVYKIINQINAGGMAEIFLGVAYNDFGFDQIVTIKRLNKKYADDSAAQELFMREANILRRLNHTNISNFIGFAEIAGHRSIVIGFVHGRNCRDLLEFSKKLKMNVSVSMAVHIATEVARGLSYCHSFKDPQANQPMQVLHCDISPENMLISYEGEVKLIDFGVAQVPGMQGFEEDGKLKGKVRYMSPEFIKSSKGSPAADIYSLGMVLYELLLGQDLFVGQSIDEIYDKKLSPPPPEALMEGNEQVDLELANLVFKCIQPDIKNRYTSAMQLEKDLSLYFHRRDPEYMPRKLGNFLKQVFSKDHQKIESIIQESVIQQKDPDVGKSIVIGQDENTKIPQSIEEILHLFKNKEADVPIIHRGKTLELDHDEASIKLASAHPGRSSTGIKVAPSPVITQSAQTPAIQQQKPKAPQRQTAQARPPSQFRSSQPQARSVHPQNRKRVKVPRRRNNSGLNNLLQLLLFAAVLALGVLYLRSNPAMLQKIKSLIGL